MKRILPVLLFLILLLTGCDSMISSPVTSPYLPTKPAKPQSSYDEVLLTSLSYGDYRLRGEELPFYRVLGDEVTPLRVKGVAYDEGIYISPISDEEKGYIEYDISSLSEQYDTFVCKAGCLDGENGKITFTFLVDGKLMSRTPQLTSGKDGYVIDVVIPYGARTLRIECAGDIAGVVGNGRFLQSQYLDRVKWPR